MKGEKKKQRRASPADLGASVHRVERLPRQCVPEPNAAVSGPAARGQQPMLMG